MAVYSKFQGPSLSFIFCNYVAHVVFNTDFCTCICIFVPLINQFNLFPGRRAGTPVQPNDPESAGFQRESWASPYVSGSSYSSVPAPPSSDKLYNGYHRSAYASSIWLPGCYWSPPSSTSTTSSIPACHASSTTSTRLHAASSTSTGMLLCTDYKIKVSAIA